MVPQAGGLVEPAISRSIEFMDSCEMRVNGEAHDLPSQPGPDQDRYVRSAARQFQARIGGWEAAPWGAAIFHQVPQVPDRGQPPVCF